MLAVQMRTPSVPCLSPVLGFPLLPGVPISSIFSPQHMSLVHSLAQCLQTRGAALRPWRQCGWKEATRLGLSSESSPHGFLSPPHWTSRQCLITSICPTDSQGSSCQGLKNFQFPPHPAFPGYFPSLGPLVSPPLYPASCSFSSWPHGIGEWVQERGFCKGQEPSSPKGGFDSSREQKSGKTGQRSHWDSMSILQMGKLRPQSR